jgi:ubiquinone/menaquinone biosynthesis C-methylase UbiE
LQEKLATLTMLSNSFILTSLLWAWILASIIDRKLNLAAIVLCVTAVLTLFGVIHSPLAENRLFLPTGPDSWGDWVLDVKYRAIVMEYALAYLASAGLLVVWKSLVPLDSLPPIDTHGDESILGFGAGPNDSQTRTSTNAQVAGALAVQSLAAQPLATRTLEPEVMDTFEAAMMYDQMDHQAVNRKFVDDLVSGGEVGGEVIDLGTGTALIPIELCERVEGVRVLAIDASAEMLDLARRRIEIAQMTQRIQLEQADCKALKGFGGAMADTVISNTVIHHLPHPSLMVGEAIRLLRDGGRLFIRDLVRPATIGEVDALVAAHAANETEEARAMFRDSLLAALTIDEAREMFASFGLPAANVRMTSDRHWTFDGTVAKTG